VNFVVDVAVFFRVSTTDTDTVPVDTGTLTVTVKEDVVVGATLIPSKYTYCMLERFAPVIVRTVFAVPVRGVIPVREGIDIILNAEIIIEPMNGKALRSTVYSCLMRHMNKKIRTALFPWVQRISGYVR
jgi:hypothetical protein